MKIENFEKAKDLIGEIRLLDSTVKDLQRMLEYTEDSRGGEICGFMAAVKRKNVGSLSCAITKENFRTVVKNSLNNTLDTLEEKKEELEKL